MVRFYLWELRKPTNNLIMPTSLSSFSLDVKCQNFTLFLQRLKEISCHCHCLLVNIFHFSKWNYYIWGKKRLGSVLFFFCFFFNVVTLSYVEEWVSFVHFYPAKLYVKLLWAPSMLLLETQLRRQPHQSKLLSTHPHTTCIAQDITQAPLVLFHPSPG